MLIQPIRGLTIDVRPQIIAGDAGAGLRRKDIRRRQLALTRNPLLHCLRSHADQTSKGRLAACPFDR